ncbi:hypothetical protein C8A01DRAFT_19145 [Parachaetomium inaequale]|uniref:F-box domain-containing protein n=1 Tax=Parachaetomium inaequale TaxID=2588326 RepID=A0AAN6PAT1_9PEZI|nr:hypothetical protein C8A01DRAFT_19145 [Parachaetomium inaequale]
MGQVLTCLRRFLLRTPPKLPPTGLLRLPVELLLSIAAQLSSSESPESLVALSLTCKHLRLALAEDVAKTHVRCRLGFLALLERDLGDRFFYCSACCQLHVFSPSWTPTQKAYTVHETMKCNRFYCHAFNPNRESCPYKYHFLARLVMNRHLHGPPHGLPLESLARPVWVYRRGAGPLWRQTPSARVLGDELFLCITHTLEGRASTLRDAIDKGRHQICTHVRTDLASRSGINAMPQLEKPNGLALFQACQNVLRSCAECLTDYTITVETAEAREVYRVCTEEATVCASENLARRHSCRPLARLAPWDSAFPARSSGGESSVSCCATRALAG